MLLALSACADPTVSDQALHRDLETGANGAEVYFHATLLSAPYRAGGHERMEVRNVAGDLLEVDHNLSLAPWAAAAKGDVVLVRGRLYIDGPGRAGVHCTHAATSLSCPYPGWIQVGQTRFS